MGTKTWKAEEQMVANIVGGKRDSSKGNESPDVTSDLFVINVKERKQLPQWMIAALTKLRNKAGARQIPALVLHETGTADRLIIANLHDIIRLMQALLPQAKEKKEPVHGNNR